MRFVKCKIRNQDKYKWIAVSDEDFEMVNKHKWTMNASGYPSSSVYDKQTKKRKGIYMHRLIMGFPKELQVDHIDGSKTNNIRKNLRLCTQTENLRNKRVYSNNTSGHKNVSWNKRRNKWRVRISVDGKKKELGHFDSLVAASYAYNHAAIKHYGEFARLNEIEKPPFAESGIENNISPLL